ncbi:MAG: SIR2 family protein, partial [Caldilineaceae bacterium]|nr:SIR2 family protein [Caldilineaceae bacterium]
NIQDGVITPFISGHLCYDYLFQGHFRSKIEDWAEDMEYPWTARSNVTQVAQYCRIRRGERATRNYYLKFLKEELLEDAYEKPEMSRRALEKVANKLENASFTEVAADLGYLDFANLPEHPLRVLAELPLPIYVTTCYHQLLESALEQMDKKPVSETYWWADRNTGRMGESIFTSEPGYEPSEERPLVFHLFGRDDNPQSLVITENDFLDFLINLSRDLYDTTVGGKPETQSLPTVVTNTLGESSPFLLGYDMTKWDFRILFRGLLSAEHITRREEGMFIQVEQDNVQMEEEVQRDLEKYLLQTSKLRIYSGTPNDCLEEIHRLWQRG